MNKCFLSSSDGWNQFILERKKSFSDDENNIFYIIEVNILGNFWERNKSVNQAELVRDFSVSLPQVILKKIEVINLIEELKSWLDLPHEIKVNFSTHEEQTMSIRLGLDDDFICSAAKPVCSIRYSAARMKNSEWKFIVDQSCVANFINDLNAIVDN